MKRYVIPIVSILVVLMVAWVSFAQPEVKEVKVSAETSRPSRGRGLSRELRLKAVAVIEEQLTKIKSGLESSSGGRERGQNLSDEERTARREQYRKLREQQQQSIAIIEDQIAKLQGQRTLQAKHDESIGKLNAIRDLALKEKAVETAAAIEKLIAEQKKEFEARLQKLGLQQAPSRTNN